MEKVKRCEYFLDALYNIIYKMGNNKTRRPKKKNNNIVVAEMQRVDDVHLTLKHSETGREIESRFESGDDFMVSVICAMGEECATGVKPLANK